MSNLTLSCLWINVWSVGQSVSLLWDGVLVNRAWPSDLWNLGTVVQCEVSAGGFVPRLRELPQETPWSSLQAVQSQKHVISCFDL